MSLEVLLRFEIEVKDEVESNEDEEPLRSEGEAEADDSSSEVGEEVLKDELLKGFLLRLEFLLLLVDRRVPYLYPSDEDDEAGGIGSWFVEILFFPLVELIFGFKVELTAVELARAAILIEELNRL